MPRGFTVVGRRSAKIVTASPHAPRKHLLVNHPIGQTILTEDLGTLRTKSRIQICIAKRHGAFFHVPVRINVAHRYYLLVSETGCLIIYPLAISSMLFHCSSVTFMIERRGSLARSKFFNLELPFT